jgi:hyperosmotically inducible periplasmic protein
MAGICFDCQISDERRSEEAMMFIRMTCFATIVAGGLFLGGCSNTAAGAREDAANAANKVTSAASDAGKAVTSAASDAGKATADAAASTGATVAAAVETIDVKSALIADRTVDASAINVDTLPQTKTVVLKGSVPTAEQREEAGRIAAAEAPGYRIDNQLAVVKPER